MTYTETAMIAAAIITSRTLPVTTTSENAAAHKTELAALLCAALNRGRREVLNDED